VVVYNEKELLGGWWFLETGCVSSRSIYTAGTILVASVDVEPGAPFREENSGSTGYTFRSVGTIPSSVPSVSTVVLVRVRFAISRPRDLLSWINTRNPLC
jgi:hypothetical protein